jgi:hypothetical protein
MVTEVEHPWILLAALLASSPLIWLTFQFFFQICAKTFKKIAYGFCWRPALILP